MREADTHGNNDSVSNALIAPRGKPWRLKSQAILLFVQ